MLTLEVTSEVMFVRVTPTAPSVEKVLAYVNVARGALGLSQLDSLPPGSRGKGSDCVIARSLGAVVSSVTVCFGNQHERAQRLALAWASPVMPHCAHCGGFAVALPETLVQFVAAFDGGAYPELVTA